MAPAETYDWIYGGEGDDAIFGDGKAADAYLFGNEGHDYIRGGTFTTDTTIWGGSGDDFIRPGNKKAAPGLAKVKGGKGDDVINETAYNEELM